MTEETLSNMTTIEFEQHVETWGRIRDQAMADSMALPGPGWRPVLDRLHQEALLLNAEWRCRAG